MKITEEVEKGRIRITHRGSYTVVIEGTSREDTLYFEFREWGDRYNDNLFHRYFTVRKEMLPALLRAISIVMRTQNIEKRTIMNIASNGIDRYNHITHGMKNPNDIRQLD